MQKCQLYICVGQSYACNTIGSVFSGHSVYIDIDFYYLSTRPSGEFVRFLLDSTYCFILGLQMIVPLFQ